MCPVAWSCLHLTWIATLRSLRPVAHSGESWPASDSPCRKRDYRVDIKTFISLSLYGNSMSIYRANNECWFEFILISAAAGVWSWHNCDIWLVIMIHWVDLIPRFFILLATTRQRHSLFWKMLSGILTRLGTMGRKRGREWAKRLDPPNMYLLYTINCSNEKDLGLYDFLAKDGGI